MRATVSNLCLCFQTREPAVSQQVQSASVSVNSDQVTEQSRRCKLSVAKKREQLRVHKLNSHENPALRHNRDFNITTAQRQHEAMQISSESMRSAAVTHTFVTIEFM